MFGDSDPVAYTELIDRLNPSVPGCPYETINKAVQKAARRICEMTLAYRYEVPKYQLLPGVHEYAFNNPLETEVHAIFGAHVNDRPLTKLNLDEALRHYPEWADLYSGEAADVAWSETPTENFNDDQYNVEQFNAQPEYVLPEQIVAKAGSPRVITQVAPTRYVILPAPNADVPYIMRMFVALKPTKTASGLAKFAFEELEDAIFHRTLQDLLILPNVPWADREAAAYHARQVTYHTAERRARANLGNARGAMQVKFRRFA